jgi:hypothetical protein
MSNWSRTSRARAHLNRKPHETALAAAYKKALPTATPHHIDALTKQRLGLGDQPPAAMFERAMQALVEGD